MSDETKAPEVTDENKDQATPAVQPEKPVETISVELEDTLQEMNEEREGVLSDGVRFKVLTGKGKDMMKAQEQAGTNTGDIMPILMQKLVVFSNTDGVEYAKKPIEYIENLPLKDFSAVQVKFAEVNF